MQAWGVAISGARWERTVPSFKYCGKRVYHLPENKGPCRLQPEALSGLGGMALLQKGVHKGQDPLRHQGLNSLEHLGGVEDYGTEQATCSHCSARAAATAWFGTPSLGGDLRVSPFVCPSPTQWGFRHGQLAHSGGGTCLRQAPPLRAC